MNPLISVIVPIYNNEKYLKQCLDSIVNQSYRNIEIILINDSTDSSGQICDEYAKKDDRVSVYHGDKKTLTYARKKGLDFAKGEYIGFVDGDDWIDEDMYQQLKEYMCQYDVDIVSTGFYKYQNERIFSVYDSVKTGLYTYEKNYMDIINVLISASSGTGGCMVHNVWSKLYKADIIKRAFQTMDDDIAIAEDWLAFTKAVLASKSIYVVNKAFYYYRDNAASMTRTRDSHFFSKFNILYNAFRDELLVHDEYVDILSKQLVNAMADYLLDGVNNLFDFGFNLSVSVPRYQLPEDFLKSSKNIILCGAGKVGRSYYYELCNRPEYNLIGWIDSNYDNLDHSNDIIQSIEYVKETDYDIILLGAFRKEMAESMRNSLKKMGVLEEKIVWREPQKCVVLNEDAF